MPLDAIYLGALIKELGAATIGGKIDKIYQPEKDELIFNVRNISGNCKLLVCCSANHPRIQLAQGTYENPASPPMLCMLLRKHLMGARIMNIRQLPFERVIILDFEGLNELFEMEKKQLVLEIMGRQSNIIFCGGDEKIMTAIKYSELSDSSGRLILPGSTYQPPSPQDKYYPQIQNLPVLMAKIQEKRQEKLDEFILKNIMGLSPLIARELSFRITGSVDFLICDMNHDQIYEAQETLRCFLETAEHDEFTPWLLEDENHKPVDFSYMKILQYGKKINSREMEGFIHALDDFYYLRDKVERVHHRTNDIHKLLTATKDRLTKKIGLQKIEFNESKNREHLRVCGELLTANIDHLDRGMKSISVLNYYDENLAMLEIPLDVKLSGAKNAQRYFNMYQKAKNAQIVLEEQLKKAEDELEYVESVLDSLSRIETEKEINEIREELSAAGIIHSKEKKKGAKRVQISSPMHFESSDGFDIYVGKNNTQNDVLTQNAKRNDIWLHVQIGAGSHVIISANEREVPDNTLTQGATLAAYYSSANGSSNVPVCYTRICYVKKPNGAKPGKVIYKNYQTAFVTPNECLVKELKK